jgi:hypothetical protein
MKRTLLIVGVVNTTGFLPPAAEGTLATSFEGLRKTGSENGELVGLAIGREVKSGATNHSLP